MFQLTIPGFEDSIRMKDIFEPVKTIKYLEDKGYEWLSDYNSGSLLVNTEHDVYVPYRIKFPDNRIINEFKIFDEASKLEKLGFSREEIANARRLYLAVNHEKTNKDLYKFNNYSFISEEDEEQTLKYFRLNPVFD